MHQIPTVDLADLHSDDRARRDRATAALRVGFGDFGLVYVSGHDVDTAQLSRFYDDLVALFARPEAEKRSWARPDIWYQRGWTPPNTEQAVVAGGQPDFKECYFAATQDLDQRCKLMFPEIYAENTWPEKADNFSSDYMALGTSVHRVGMALLGGCEASLGLETGFFDQVTRGAPHVTRALRYLPLDETQVGTSILWGEEHTDFNLLTLLPGGQFFDPKGARCDRPDNGSGLYLRTRPTVASPKGEMLAGKPPAGCIVAQVGQELEILTAGTFLATPHVIKAPTSPGYTRTALAHFIHVHSERRLFPHDRFLTDEAIAAYGPPVLAGTYGLKTLVDIGLAPRTALDKLGYRHYDRLADARSK